MPTPVVQRAGQLIQQAAALVCIGAAAFRGDALLQHFADHPTVFGAPEIRAGVEQAAACGLEAHRCAISTFGQGFPLQTEAHAVEVGRLSNSSLIALT